MTDFSSLPVGAIGWSDLTVPNAEEVRDFYRAVVGWEAVGVEMDDYSDFLMNDPSTGDTQAGVCHARGRNADLPPQWLVYIRVEDLDRSMERCAAVGGRVTAGPKPLGGDARYCVVEDPAGAVAALFEGDPSGPS